MTVPDGVRIINNGTFGKCHQLTSVNIPDGVTYVGLYAFQGCGLSEIDIPDSVTEVGAYAFINCQYLRKVTFGSGVRCIGCYVFSGCVSLENVYFKGVSGWWVSAKADATGGPGISSQDIQDASTVVRFLTMTYCDQYWRRRG